MKLLIISTIMGLVFAHISYPIFDNLTKSRKEKINETLNQNLEIIKQIENMFIEHNGTIDKTTIETLNKTKTKLEQEVKKLKTMLESEK